MFKYMKIKKLENRSPGSNSKYKTLLKNNVIKVVKRNQELKNFTETFTIIKFWPATSLCSSIFKQQLIDPSAIAIQQQFWFFCSVVAEILDDGVLGCKIWFVYFWQM